MGGVESGAADCRAGIGSGTIVVGPQRLGKGHRDGSPHCVSRTQECGGPLARGARHRDRSQRLEGRGHADQIAKVPHQFNASAAGLLRLFELSAVKTQDR
jgi:hypothetical protein